MFMNEISAFFDAIENGKQSSITLNEAHDVLLICKAQKFIIQEFSLLFFMNKKIQIFLFAR